jgi:hypothetical protein
MTDPWEAILIDLEPDYKLLKNMLEIIPDIKPTLYQNKQKKCIITFEETWPDLSNHQIQNFETTYSLDDRIAWIEKSLENWNSAKRTSWNAWIFSTKREAEKFLILYNLTWTK